MSFTTRTAPADVRRVAASFTGEALRGNHPFVPGCLGTYARIMTSGRSVDRLIGRPTGFGDAAGAEQQAVAG